MCVSQENISPLCRWGRLEPAPSVRESRWGPEIPTTDSFPEWGVGPSWGRRSPPPPVAEMWGDHQGKGRPADYPNLGGEPYHQSRYPPSDGPEAQGYPPGPSKRAHPSNAPLKGQFPLFRHFVHVQLTLHAVQCVFVSVFIGGHCARKSVT